MIIRVGEKNNFNFTCKELKQMEKYECKKCFVNSNSFVKIKANYPSIITTNPYLDKFIMPKGDISNVKACRIKYVDSATVEVKQAFNESLQFCKDNNIPALITYMRFSSKKSIFKYTILKNDKEIKSSNYTWRGNYYRQNKKQLFTGKNIYYCDKLEKGCPDCNNCSKLTYGKKEEVASLNLSTSGVCKFNCPDCWAKKVTYGKAPQFDKIKQNRKQLGLLQH